MRIRVEAGGLHLGVDGAITEAMTSGNWGIRLTFMSDDNDGRFEVCITEDKALSLIKRLTQSLESIEKVKRSLAKSVQEANR